MAGERAEIIADLRAAFLNELYDAVISATFTNYEKDAYNATTGSITKTVESTASAPAILSSHWQYEIFNSNIEPSDEGLIIIQDDLLLTPRISTEVSFSGKTSRVVEVRQDPMNAIWELRIRY